MDKYEVIGKLGEGSFGRVYKAKQLSSGNLVALKVISKRGRSEKELKGFRRECEIQRDLHHPNIIQMLDSFETKYEIVVITEFAPKELTGVLSEVGYLTEDKVQVIVWDLVSALYYLHSNRVLHRDLKPQNILLDLKNRAKLCDFGFARNMSTGTHVLTSIKGTPLYMAPELIDELPYDYNADLWSLGCIIYELLIGTPPFCTNSILHLIKKIQTEEIKWPTFLSPECTSFLKGLLRKNPSERLTWNQILNHSFVKGHILISKSTAPMPLTKSLTASAREVKEQQRKDSMNNKHLRDHKKSNTQENKAPNSKSAEKPTEIKENSESVDLEALSKCLKEKLNFIEDNHPIEPEEWIVFLQKSIQEVINGEMSSLLQPHSTNIIVSPLRNSNSNSKVLSYVAKLLSIAFVVEGTSEDTLKQVRKVYLEVKLLPNLVYAAKLLLRNPRPIDSKSSNECSHKGPDTYKNLSKLDVDDVQALEHLVTLICFLVHLEDDFLVQFCDAVVVLNVFGMVNMLFGLAKKKNRISMEVLSILTHTMRRLPENSEIIERIVCHPDSQLNLGEFLRNSSSSMRERSCFFTLLMGKHFKEKTMDKIWTVEVRDTLEALQFDSIESVRNAAETAVIELKDRGFYIKGSTSFC